MGQEDLSKFVSEVKLPVEEYKKYADEAYIFDDTVPKQARPLDALPLQAPQGQPQVMVMPPSQGYPMLSQSMHLYHGGVMMKEQQQQPMPFSYNGFSNQMTGQSYQQQPQMSGSLASFNAHPAYNLGGSMRDNGQYI